MIPLAKLVTLKLMELESAIALGVSIKLPSSVIY